MRGLIINLFKEPLTTLIDTREQVHNITWMHYDYYSLKEVKNFEGYFLYKNGHEDRLEQEGESQSMYLYSFDMISKEEGKQNQETKFEISKKDEEAIKVLKIDGTEIIPNFLCLITMKLKSVYQDKSYNKYLIESKECFEKALIDDDVKDLYYEWFGTLGSEDLVLLVAGDSIQKFVRILEKIRNDELCCENLYSTYSFTLSNKRVISNDIFLDVNATISFTVNPSQGLQNYVYKLQKKILDSFSDIDEVTKDSLNTNKEMEQYLEESKGIKFYGMVGKYDYFIFVPKNSWNFLPEFNKGGIFHIENSSYSSNVYQTKTSWLYKTNFEDITSRDEKTFQTQLKENNEIKDKIKNINNKILEVNKTVSGYMKRSFHIDKALDLLFSDFKKNIKSMFAVEWRDDLHEQFDAFLSIIEKSLESGEEKIPSDVLEEMINSIRQTYIHITQASRLFFEIPSTNLRYTGSYNKVLRAYYGIVKRYLYIAYSIKKNINSKQSVLIPVITFEYTSRVNTHLYIQSNNSNDKRLVAFHLPYDALTDIPKYMAYLCHEVYHYISPADRELRNKTVIKICLTYHYFNCFEQILYNYLEKELNKHISYRCELEEVIRAFLIKNYTYIEDIVVKKYETLKVYVEENEGHKKTFSNFVLLWKEIIKENLSGINGEGRLKAELKSFFSDFLSKSVELTEDDFSEGTNKINLDIMHGINSLNYDKIILDDNNVVFSQEQDKILINNTLYYLDIMQHGLKEACCDLFAIEILNMGFDEYFDYIAGFLYDAEIFDLDNTNAVEIINNKKAQTSFFERIGMIIYYFYASDGKVQDIDDVEKRIRNLQLNIRKEVPENEKNTMDSWKENLKEMLVESYKQYISNFGTAADAIYRLMSTGIITNDLVEKDERLYEYLKDIRSAFQYYKRVPNTKQYEGGIFQINLDVMHICQKQPLFKDLKEWIDKNTQNNINLIGGKTLEKDTKMKMSFKEYEIWVEGLEEYIKVLQRIGEFLSGDDRVKTNLLWYRGHPNKNFYLVPNILRGLDANICPLEYEIGLMDLYQAKAPYSMNETFPKMGTEFDWLVSMQHYELQTHLLDWSENAFVALFFALSNIGHKDVFKMTETDASVYVLKPEAMYRAREAMIKKTPPSKLKLFSYPIINFSTSYHNKEYQDFIPIVPDKDLSKRYEEWHSSDYRQNASWWPVPIVCSLSNPRIRSQYGSFTAFNLMTKPDPDYKIIYAEKGKRKEKLDPYGYIRIENMQSEFLNMFPEEKPFLFKINIPQGAVESLMKALRQTGIRVMNVYPELDKIGKDIKEQVDNYFRYAIKEQTKTKL